MSLGWGGWLAAVAGLVLTGLAVRLVDDALDQEEDAAAQVPNLAAALGPGSVAYAGASLALAALLLPQHGPALFLAAYAWGMAGALTERLPSRLPGWLESIGAVALLLLLVPGGVGLWALLLMGAFQAADWAVDGAPGPVRSGGGRLAGGLAGRLGARVWPALALGLGLPALSLAPGLTVAAVGAGAFLELAVKGRGRGRARG